MQWSPLAPWLWGRGMTTYSKFTYPSRVQIIYPKFMNITKSQDSFGWKLISFQSPARGRDTLQVSRLPA